MKPIMKRFVRLFIGLCIMSFGSAMALVADLGMEPWDVLNDGMAKFLQGIFDIQLANGADLITFGRANITIGFTILFKIHGWGSLLCVLAGVLAWLTYLLTLRMGSSDPIRQEAVR